MNFIIKPKSPTNRWKAKGKMNEKKVKLNLVLLSNQRPNHLLPLTSSCLQIHFLLYLHFHNLREWTHDACWFTALLMHAITSDYKDSDLTGFAFFFRSVVLWNISTTGVMKFSLRFLELACTRLFKKKLINSSLVMLSTCSTSVNWTHLTLSSNPILLTGTHLNSFLLLFQVIFTLCMSITLIDCAKLLRTPKVYNAIITTDENLTPSRAFPVIQPVFQPAIPVLSPFYPTFNPYSRNDVTVRCSIKLSCTFPNPCQYFSERATSSSKKKR